MRARTSAISHAPDLTAAAKAIRAAQKRLKQSSNTTDRPVSSQENKRKTDYFLLKFGKYI